MRKIAVLLVAAAALGVAAQSASADVPNPDYQVINYGPVKDFTCRTGPLYGVSGQYGAWGYFIDGCTVRLACPSTNFNTTCLVYAQSTISAESGAPRVTQNMRLRAIRGSDNSVAWFRDQSCAGYGWCSNTDSVRINRGNYASVQCNGVRAPESVFNRASNSCMISMRYEQ
jgi:hypothetical protein